MGAGRWITGVLVAAGLAVPAPAGAGSAGPDLFGEVDQAVPFSPNGDGRRDVARLHFKLRGEARVTAIVRRSQDVVVRTVDLGHLGKGDHVFRWDGRTGNGRVLPDRWYDVDLVAVTRAGRDVAQAHAIVDTVNRGRLVTSRPVVHPRATVVDDVVQVVFVEDGWYAFVAYDGYGSFGQARTRFEVIDRRGRVVRDEVVRKEATPTLSWDGRRGDGHAARAGRYEVRVTSVDPAGNLRRVSAALRVSDAQLLEKTWSVTLLASEAGHYVPDFGGCNGCYDHCGPAASSRFAGGLSFRPCEGFGFFTRGYYAASAPVVPAPVDSFRITAVGGPTTPGGADIGMLMVGEQLVITTPVGDGATTSPWFPVALNAYPYLPSVQTPVFWSFGTNLPHSYDVATFTVEYRYYVPVS